ncbi:RidA family protein [Streptococcus halichoeri]|uniref:RidA family protein n=1 Tax=Streptococcus halichoeri TaxID=254785 RepID=UPI00135723A6|nr:RidA family protein [Streptococcus halichoeri]
MKSIRRYDVNESAGYTGLVEAGDFYFINYCCGNIGDSIEDQINGAFDEMERRLGLVGLTLEAVVKMDCLFRDIWNNPVLEKIIKDRFNGQYPARKAIQTEFAQEGGPAGLLFQIDAIAYSKPGVLDEH